MPHSGTKRRTGAALIVAERERQMAVEGWTPEHDDHHADSSLNFAAQAYCQGALEPGLWPAPDAPAPPNTTEETP